MSTSPLWMQQLLDACASATLKTSLNSALTTAGLAELSDAGFIYAWSGGPQRPLPQRPFVQVDFEGRRAIEVPAMTGTALAPGDGSQIELVAIGFALRCDGDMRDALAYEGAFALWLREIGGTIRTAVTGATLIDWMIAEKQLDDITEVEGRRNLKTWAITVDVLAKMQW